MLRTRGLWQSLLLSGLITVYVAPDKCVLARADDWEKLRQQLYQAEKELKEIERKLTF